MPLLPLPRVSGLGQLSPLEAFQLSLQCKCSATVDVCGLYHDLHRTNRYLPNRELDNEADQLLSVQNALSSQLSSLESEIEALRSQLPALTSQRSQYQEVTRSISNMQEDCIEMRGGANELSAQLLDDRKRLTGARLRVDKIAADLRSIEFASTRRQITGQLNEIMQDLANVGGAAVAMSNRKRLEQTRSLVLKIGSSTPKVLMILERTT